VSGLTTKKAAKANKFLKMAIFMKEVGFQVLEMVKVNISGKMEIFL
jgi:hypothetical protein